MRLTETQGRLDNPQLPRDAPIVTRYWERRALALPLASN
jgi:hypothetical protein